MLPGVLIQAFQSKYYNYAIITLAILMASSAFAADQNAAARVCERASFSSDRRACIDEVRRGRYFDDRALQICTTLSFSSNYPACIRALRDKRYQEFELRECHRQSFDDYKVDCLAQYGQLGGGGYPYPPYNPPHQPPHGQPGYGYGITAPGITNSWIRGREEKVSKVGDVISIYLRGSYVNEVALVAAKEDLHINSVLVYLVDGQVMSLQQFNSRRLRENQVLRDRLDRRHSLRVDRIEVNATSGLIGSRGIIRVDVGIYR